MTPAPRPSPSELLPGKGGPRPVPDLYELVPGRAAGDAGAPDSLGGSGASPTGRPRRGPVSRRRTVTAAAVTAALLLVVGLVASLVAPAATGSRHNSAFAAPGPAPVSGNRAQAAAHPSANLPAATAAPAPAPPSLVDSAPLQSHEVFGYAPYWSLPASSGFDVKDLTTLAYFSVDANSDGSLAQTGPGWNGYQSQDLVNLVTRAHAAGARVVLTVTCFDQRALDRITSDPNAPARLSAALIAAIQAKHLDGVNFDFEGLGSADRAGLTRLVTAVSAALHATDPHWQVSMAVYASAAGDPGGFYDVAALAPALDAFFVMAYDMNSRSQPSATSPLLGPAASDTVALEQFCRIVPPSKIILGLPYYGYDWPTTDGSPTATATGPESPVTDSTVASSGHPTYWDPVTDTPWTAYQVGTQWHKTYFDDPTSLALKAHLANSFHVAGVGIWALGMDGNDPAMLAALLGNAPVAKDGQTGPPPPPGTGYASFATYGGTADLALTPIAPPPSGGTAQMVGVLGGIGTTDPALACLQTGPPLPVWSYPSLPGVLVVQASTPTDCAVALWSFVVPTTTAGYTPIPTATATPTSSTTTIPTTTTTSATTTTTTAHPASSTTTTTTAPSTRSVP